MKKNQKKNTSSANIQDIRILPSLAIGRLGSAEEPLDNYEIHNDPQEPLGYRRITRAETLIVDTATGEITGTLPPSDEPPAFKTGKKIRPVAPFMEVFATVTENDESRLVPLDMHLLEAAGLRVRWQIATGNLKVFRRTQKDKDKILAHINNLEDHALHPLKGESKHFIKGADGKRKHIPLGSMQFIKPTAAYPEIRLRFTPGNGLVYGSTPWPGHPNEEIPQEMGGPCYSDVKIPEERIVYDSDKGTWNGKYKDDNATLNTLSQGLYAAYGKAPFFNYYEDPQPARGYLDDACDGIVTVELVDKNDKVRFSAKTRFCAAPPIFAPDSEFVRTVQDDVMQVLLGPSHADPDAVPISAAQDIVRRAYETVRFMNLNVLNGDTIKGRPNHADTMPADDASDFNRPYEPIMAPHSIDTLSITALHQQLYTTMASGVPAWFYDLLRQPNETADLTDKGRRKMPAMMSGADTCYLALTYRQLDTIKQAGRGGMFDTPPNAENEGLTPRNLTAQLQYRGRGNPFNTHIASSVGNCCPGLELDFRSVWKRAFEGITLVEHDNYVLDTDEKHKDLLGHRLLIIEIPDDAGVPQKWPVVVQAIGPTADGSDVGPIPSADSQESIVNLEWSNTLSHIWKFRGQTLTCHFTKEKMLDRQVLADDKKTITRKLRVRDFFESGTTVINEAMASPGELTQGLCSPWQNDFRECVCYYWASSRPDYVNVEPAGDGASRGDNWMTKERSGQYVVDDYKDNRLINYQDLFNEWEDLLKFQIGGRDDPNEG